MADEEKVVKKKKSEKKALPKAEKVAEKPKKVKKALPPMNEELYRVGDELELKGSPFKVKEIAGVHLVLARTDIK